MSLLRRSLLLVLLPSNVLQGRELDRRERSGLFPLTNAPTNRLLCSHFPLLLLPIAPSTSSRPLRFPQTHSHFKRTSQHCTYCLLPLQGPSSLATKLLLALEKRRSKNRQAPRTNCSRRYASLVLLRSNSTSVSSFSSPALPLVNSLTRLQLNYYMHNLYGSLMIINGIGYDNLEVCDANWGNINGALSGVVAALLDIGYRRREADCMWVTQEAKDLAALGPALRGALDEYFYTEYAQLSNS